MTRRPVGVQGRQHVRHRADHQRYLVGYGAGRDRDVQDPPTRFVVAVELQAGRVQRSDDALLPHHDVGGSGAGQSDPAAREDHTALGGGVRGAVRQRAEGGSDRSGSRREHREDGAGGAGRVCVGVAAAGLQPFPQLADA